MGLLTTVQDLVDQQICHHQMASIVRDRKKTSSILASDLKISAGVSVDSSTAGSQLIYGSERTSSCQKAATEKRKLTKDNTMFPTTTKLDIWRNVLRTDESKFLIFGSNKRQYIRCRWNKRTMNKPASQDDGGSVQVWDV